MRALAPGSPAEAVRIPPLGIYKAPFRLRPSRLKPSINRVPVTLEAVDLSGRRGPPARVQINLRVRQPAETCVRTFRSAIDGSVQYYAVNVASPAQDAATPPALFLSLHGAGVEARGQAEAYSPKSWGPIVCPTNRRPYGFDWEEWGRAAVVSSRCWRRKA